MRHTSTTIYLPVLSKRSREVALVSMDLTCFESMPIASGVQVQQVIKIRLMPVYKIRTK
jgi:hypothetical protein